MSVPIVTLTTDFGDTDVFVGVMKGVILSICPQARLVDLSHQITPQDIHAAAWLLQSAMDYFPCTTIHLVVVDPGVGTKRKPIVIRTPRGFFVGPDNGLFFPMWKSEIARWTGRDDLKIVEISNQQYCLNNISQTFHGRDIFAPVAAHLANGVSLDEFGPVLENLQSLTTPEPCLDEPNNLMGHIMHIDRFGNCISNVHIEHLNRLGGADRFSVFLRNIEIGPIHKTYADVPVGAVCAIMNSSGYLELSVRQGDLQALLSVDRFAPISVVKKQNLNVAKPADQR